MLWGSTCGRYTKILAGHRAQLWVAYLVYPPPSQGIIFSINGRSHQVTVYLCLCNIFKFNRLHWSWKNCQETSSPFPPRAVHFEASEQFQCETSSPSRWKKQPFVLQLDFTEILYFCEIHNYHLPDDMYVLLSLPSPSSVGSWWQGCCQCRCTVFWT